jgi:hypothetical protein
MFGLSTVAIRWIGGVLLVLLVVGGIYAKGRHDVQVKFDAYKAEVKAVAAAQEQRTKLVEEKNRKLNEEIKDAYNTKLANLRSYYGVRLGKSGGSLPQVSGTSNGVNDYSPDNLPPTTVLASQCAETTLNLLSLQDWVRGAVNNAE